MDFQTVRKIKDQLAHDEMDPVACKQTLTYIEELERHYQSACAVADAYKQDFHSALGAT